MYTKNNRASKYMKQNLIELKGEIDKSTIMIGNFNVHILPTNRITAEKISKEIDMNNRI